MQTETNVLNILLFRFLAMIIFLVFLDGLYDFLLHSCKEFNRKHPPVHLAIVVVAIPSITFFNGCLRSP